VNGFHNLIFDNYELTWYDGRSPANFYIIKNILEKKTISFSKGYLIGGIKVENNMDFYEIHGSYYPIFNFLGDYVYAGILSLLYSSTELQLFKGMILLNTAFSAFTLIVFYFVQKNIGLNTKYSFLSTLIAGIATAILIYSRYLFIEYTILGLLFISLIYILLKYRKKMSLKIEVFTVIILSLFLIFLWYKYIILIFFVILSYFFIRDKLVRTKILIISGLIVCISLTLLNLFYSGITPRISPSGINNIIQIENVPIIAIFSNYVNALDYIVYGYHDPASVWKLYRVYPYIYGFKQEPGNAIFFRFYGLFVPFFGPKGVVYNSPFLIFSILGIFAYKDREKKNLLLLFIILMILVYGLLSPIWYGGVSPRYVRHFLILILLLTFFSFYYIQTTKNNWIKLIFLGLVILSILNVTSLAIRADWNYEHEADLFSYDLVLWSWYPPSKEIESGKIVMTSAEIPYWRLSGEGNCKAKLGANGLMTDPCFCEYDSWAERDIELKKNIKNISIEACAVKAGDDKTRGFVYIDDELIGEVLIDSNTCRSENFSVDLKPGEHTIRFKSGIYGNCDGEMIFWKSIKFE